VGSYHISSYKYPEFSANFCDEPAQVGLLFQGLFEILTGSTAFSKWPIISSNTIIAICEANKELRKPSRMKMRGRDDATRDARETTNHN